MGFCSGFVRGSATKIILLPNKNRTMPEQSPDKTKAIKIIIIEKTFNFVPIEQIMEIRIRPYQTSDAEIIVGILNHYIANSTALYDYELRTIEQQQAIFDEKLQKGFPVIVATIDDLIVGFGYYSEFRFREAYKFTVEHSVYVAHSEHGKGIGKVVLQSLIDLAKNQKLHTMVAVIDSENQGSIAFHEQFGFETVGNIKESGFKFERWLHSIIMQLMLE
jgi:L-amino acid N-acyltransferase YncA